MKSIAGDTIDTMVSSKGDYTHAAFGGSAVCPGLAVVCFGVGDSPDAMIPKQAEDF